MWWIALIPLSPAIAFLVIALGGRWLGEHSHRVGIAAVTVSFALAILGAILVLTNGPITLPLYTLLQSGALTVEFGLYADGVAMALMLLVSGVSAIAHVFSSRYMQGDPRYVRFFTVMALFTSAMLLLVLSANLTMLYMCWEVMGLCSYLLISHWAERRSASQAATKVFLVNAVADVGLGFGVILIWATFDSLDIQTILSRTTEVAPRTVNLLSVVGLEWSVPILFVIATLLFVGVLGKSAQFPLHVWLPYAMEAPTPVSALIHAATMVNAGVYLLIRFAPLYLQSPGAMVLVALIGGITALFAGIVGLAQCDIKRILAYSTISQLGFMVMACGVGAFRAATYHLISHGVLKAYLFLSTGSAVAAAVSAKSHHSAKPRSAAWSDAWPLYGGSLFLALVPALLLFSVPYASLWDSTSSPQAVVLYLMFGLSTSFCAAYYLSRLVLETFQKPLPSVWREALPASFVRPQFLSASLILGMIPLVVGLGLFLAVLWTAFARIFVPANAHAIPTTESLWRSTFEIRNYVVPFLVAAAGWGLAIAVRTGAWLPPAWATAARNKLYVFFMNRGYIDEVYDVFFVRPTLRSARWAWWFCDVWLIDGAYRALASFSLALSRWLWGVVDVRGIDRGVVGFGTSSLTFSRWLWRVIDVRGIDRAVTDLGASSFKTARWLWKVDVRGVDRAVTDLGASSFKTARWLSKVDVREVDRAVTDLGASSFKTARWLSKVDVRGIDRVADEIGRQSDATGQRLARLEPRTLQHHILVMIVWLVLGLVTFYLFAA